MPALDALAAKNEWWETTAPGTYGTQVTAGFLRSLARTDGVDLSAQEGMDKATQFLAGARRWLEAGEAFYVTPQFTPLVTAASESFPEEALLPSDLPSEFGFVLIPGGLQVIDVRGSLMSINAVQWASFGGEVICLMLTDKYDVQDANNLLHGHEKTWQTKMPRWSLCQIMHMKFGKALPTTAGPDMVIPPEYGVRVIYKEDQVAIVSDKGFTSEELHETFSFGTKPDPTARWLVTMWRLMQQPLTTISKEEPSRQQKRQIARKNLPDKHVSVITLRREANRGEGDTEVEWTHRWLVKGHWRKQWYGTGEDRYQRVIWIHPHVKGPENAPFLVRERVYSLAR